MGFSTEILFKASYYQYVITEIPVSINPRKFGTSYVNLITITTSVFSCILFYTLKKFNFDIKHPFLKKIIKYFYSLVKYKKLRD